MTSESQKRFILLIGAGATASIGYPLMSDISIYQEIERLPKKAFLEPEIDIEAADNLRPLIEDIEHYLLRLVGQVTFEAVIDRAIRYSQIVEEINIDDALSNVFLSNQESRNEAGLLRNRAKALYELLHKVLLNVYGKNHLRTKQHQEAAKNLVNLLNEFKKQNHSSKLLIYTTNYDATWEQIANWNGENFRFIDRSLNSNTEGQDNIPFVIRRLHGCVRYCQKAHKCFYMKDEEIDWERLAFKDDADVDYLNTDLGRKNLSHLMAIKVGEREPDLEQEPFRTVFEDFEDDLKVEGTVCVAMGFSFRDLNVSHKLFDALDIGYLNKLVCIDPSISVNDVIDRLCKAGGHSTRVNESKKNALKERIYIENCEVSSADVHKIIEKSKYQGG